MNEKKEPHFFIITGMYDENWFSLCQNSLMKFREIVIISTNQKVNAKLFLMNT